MTIDGTTSGSGPTFTLTNSNMVKADGGQLYIIDEHVANTGTLEAINSGTLKLTSLTVDNIDPLGSHDGTVAVGSNSTLDLIDAHISGGSLTNGGTVYSTGLSTIDAAISNTHSIEVGSGTLTLSGSISGTGGSATIDGGATLDLASNFLDGQDVTFAGSGAELIIEGPAANGATSQNFTGDIHGFAVTDEIDLRGISYGNPTYATYTYDLSTGVLTVNDGNGNHYDLDIGTGYAGAHFAGSDDTHGGTLITMTVDDDLPAFGQVSLTASLVRADGPDRVGCARSRGAADRGRHPQFQRCRPDRPSDRVDRARQPERDLDRHRRHHRSFGVAVGHAEGGARECTDAERPITATTTTARPTGTIRLPTARWISSGRARR